MFRVTCWVNCLLLQLCRICASLLIEQAPRTLVVAGLAAGLTCTLSGVLRVHVNLCLVRLSRTEDILRLNRILLIVGILRLLSILGSVLHMVRMSAMWLV